MPCNCWLFLLRVRAIPRHAYSRITLVICTFLWCATFTSFLLLPGIRLTSWPSSTSSTGCDYNTTFEIQFLSVPFLALVAFDTAVAISVLLGLIMHCNPHTSLPQRVKSTLLMRDMGPLCRVLLQSGYVYYLFVTTSFDIFADHPCADLYLFTQDCYWRTHIGGYFIIASPHRTKCYRAYRYH